MYCAFGESRPCKTDKAGMKDTNACTPPLQLSDNAASAAEESGSDEVRKQMMLKRVASHQLQTDRNFCARMHIK